MNIFSKKYIVTISYILIGLAVICSLYLAGQRVVIEKGYDRVEIMLNLTEAESLANANNYTLSELLTRFKEKGVTGILVKELSLGDLARSGKVQFFQGDEIKLAPYYDKLAELPPFSDADVIIAILDEYHAPQIIEHLEKKLSGAEVIDGGIPAVKVPVNMPNSDTEKELIYEDLKAVGIGFDQETLEIISKAGLNIIPQVRDWPAPTPESLEFVAGEIKKLPALSIILFNDKQVPGYPDKMSILQEELKAAGQPYAPIGIVEFFNQKGINQFAALMNKETVRVHSIAANDMINYNPGSAVERFRLAVSERNIRSLFVRFFDMDQPAAALTKNLEYLEDLRTALEEEGFVIGQAPQFKSPIYSRILIGLIGLGVIAGAALIPLQRGWKRTVVLCIAFGLMIWGGLLLREPILARKLMSLASVMVFPTLAFQTIVDKKPRSIAESTAALIKMSLISFTGAVLMVGLLADKLFMLKLDQFIGVKAAHLLPLIIIPLLLLILNDHPVQTVKRLLEQAVTYKYAILAVVALAALAIYVIRTGNEGTVLVSGIEEQLRSALKDIMGVRPRTKEFLIGHPFTLLILYYGLNNKNWFLIFPAIIGQVSLVNTYAHIHTPIVISLIRSFHGMWVGIVIGIGLIWSINWVLKLLSKSNDRENLNLTQK
ncbi:MAG: DUF5693 family protein [Peptococcaceae bacterium]